MVLWKRLGRWRWLLLGAALVILVAAGVSFVTLPLQDSDKAEAAEALVAWIVEGRSVPGFGEPYPDAQHMPACKRFFVICDFVPAEVPLSSDPRVKRITEDEYKAVFKEHRYDDTVYIRIALKSESDRVLVVDFSNAFGFLAAHGYTFEFRRKLCGLGASGKLLWVS
jgi:hypothetical protein